MESARQKDLTDVMSFRLYVNKDKKDILIHFPLLEIMIIESTRQKDQDLYIKETACKFIKFCLILLFEYKEFYFIKH